VCVCCGVPASIFLYKFQKKKKTPHSLNHQYAHSSTTHSLLPCCLTTTQRSKLNFKKTQKKTPPVSRPPHSLNSPSSSNVSGHSSDYSPQTKNQKKKDQLNVSHYFKQSGVGGASLLFESVFASSNKTRQLRVGGASL
jgi:hypothetical protein